MLDVQMYAKGSLYWYHNPEQTKEDYQKGPEVSKDFITDRPVIIVQDLSKDCLISNLQRVLVVPVSASPTATGIPLCFNMKKGVPTDTYTTVLPYRITPISKNYLQGYHGMVHQKVMDKIYDSLDYIMGRTDNVPEWIEKSNLEFRNKKEREKLLNNEDTEDFDDPIKIPITADDIVKPSEVIKAIVPVAPVVKTIVNTDETFKPQSFQAFGKRLNVDNKTGKPVLSTTTDGTTWLNKRNNVPSVLAIKKSLDTYNLLQQYYLEAYNGLNASSKEKYTSINFDDRVSLAYGAGRMQTSVDYGFSPFLTKKFIDICKKEVSMREYELYIFAEASEMRDFTFSVDPRIVCLMLNGTSSDFLQNCPSWTLADYKKVVDFYKNKK